MCVSIPHRYDKNFRRVAEIRQKVPMFQSLIGTIKTIAERFRLSPREVFQSLIGTIKTPVCFLVIHFAQNKFQSLIGTIKTPHTQVFVEKKNEFQSLIGTIKTSNGAEILLATNQFQSLIGTIKTCSTKPSCGTKAILFQSLIGTIKTYIFFVFHNPHNFGFNPS